MKRPISNFFKNCTLAAVVTAISISFIGCAHEISKIKSAPPVTPVAFTPSSTAVEEVTVQTNMTDMAYSQQVDVLAPVHFNESIIYLTKANEEKNRGSSDVEVLNTIGFARAHLNKANEDAKVTQTMVSGITNARLQALNAGAKDFPEILTPLDNQFKQIATEAIKGNNSIDTTKLQNEYLSLELSSIKVSKLEGLKDLLAQAKTKNAAKILPTAYGVAVQKYNYAEKLIETDRHSNVQIDTAVTEATMAAKRTLALLESEQNSRGQTPEQRAVILESHDKALKNADSTISQVASIAIAKNEELKARNASLAMSQDENKEHKRKERDDKIVADAAARFSNDEADVYRQEGLLIIRLKTMNFAPGRSDLPAKSLSILNKVKEVILNIGPSQITVQGHTDGTGAAKTNQKLSQNRAKSVMEYFSSDKVLDQNQIDSIGYGYTKPLSTNKTEEGRSQNRRVDIVIKPSQLI